MSTNWSCRVLRRGFSYARIAATIACLLWMGAIAAVALDDDELGSDDDGANRENRVVIVDGHTRVHIERTEHQRLGIETGHGLPHDYVAETALFGVVVDSADLLDRHFAIQQAQATIKSDKSVSAAQLQLVEHLRQMRKNGLATNLAELRREERLLAEVIARFAASELRLKQLREQALNRWGGAIGARLGHADDVLINALIAHDQTIVAIRVPGSMQLEEPYPRIFLAPGGRREEASEAQWLGPAPNVASVYGAMFYVASKQENLSVERRIKVWLSGGELATSGVAIPSSAVIWYAGAQWIYVEVEPGEFERRRVEVTVIGSDLVFVGNALAPPDIIVSRGVASLLGEEFRWSIPDEDDD